ncbi:response regulator transcription factor [Actinopolyspora mortivallis]|uniref:DNA-binding response regulator n=1 Tax=Actinopolyspora mortivallis TaxID=33906 RepID=A0A2T0GZC3_ACTMO|nr:LuxR C-terminal-related transcriptional regulator [Actinopolyspora mortivallis]PRW64454.1 DNA-binding response regulator [Actinopolyspora mortivallis]
MIDSYRKALDSAITAMLREAMEHSEALDHLVDQINQLVTLRIRLSGGSEEEAEHEDEVVRSDSSGLSRLTQREREVLDHLVRGRSNRQIARSLSISERTVKNHLHGIFTKLGVTDRTSAAIAALDESRNS